MSTLTKKGESMKHKINTALCTLAICFSLSALLAGVAYTQTSVNIGTMEPQHNLVLCSESRKLLWLDFNGDTLKVSGTLAIDSAGAIFFKWCVERYSGRIKELKDEIAVLKAKKRSATSR